MIIRSVRELDAYQERFAFQQEVFATSKSWPREETYSLTDQVRRASLSIGANLAESWAKRRYPAHFLSKLTDSDAELQESIHWIETAKASGYLDEDCHARLLERSARVGRLLGAIMAKHESFCISS
jgi:four helix bundle protein